jgi:hypothetical protein
MKPLMRFLAIHIITSAATVGILSMIPIIIYAGMVIITNDRGGDLLWIAIPLFSGGTSAVFTAIIYFPTSALADYILVKRLNLRWWFHIPLVAIILFFFGFGSAEILLWFLAAYTDATIPATARELLLPGTLFGLLVMFGGLPYWLILRFLSSTMRESEISSRTAKNAD